MSRPACRRHPPRPPTGSALGRRRPTGRAVLVSDQWRYPARDASLVAPARTAALAAGELPAFAPAGRRRPESAALMSTFLLFAPTAPGSRPVADASDRAERRIAGRARCPGQSAHGEP